MNGALAVFAKTPVPGRVKTRLVPALSPEEGAELYRCMLLDTVNRVQGMAAETVLFYDGAYDFFRSLFPALPLVQQPAAGLGERLEAAFLELSSRGYQNRLAIGTDAPDLPLGFIAEAFQLLDQGSDAVFGPAEDGGYYLVGLSGDSREVFRDIPWSTPQVLASSRERAREAGLFPALLPPWYDVDNYHDLFRPGLLDPHNGAPLTRDFLTRLGLDSRPIEEQGRTR